MTDDILKVLQDQLEFCFEKNRNATFKKWVFNDDAPCSSAKLAEAGFVFIGTKQDPDSVKCFLCNKSLDSWDEDDDPWLEHKKHSPNCSFAKMDKPERTFTLSEFIDIRNELIESCVRNALTKSFNRANADFDEIVELLNVLK